VSSEPERRWVLEQVAGPASGTGRTLGAPTELPRAGVLTIGSSRERADLALEGAGVADVHCAIGRIKGGGWALKDLGSEQGTLVNGARVQSKRLELGDRIVLGSRELRVVDANAPAPPAPPPTPPSSTAVQSGERKDPFAATEFISGPRIPGYKVEKLLGRGGMGEVFLALQERLDRKVAVKVLSERLSADADFVRRFQAEARAAAALNHPNVVVVHDVGEQEGRHYLTMEYMDRGNLESRLAREGRLSWREVLDILHDAASGLVYAELRGVVHRDIKPANLMQSHAGTTKIADLGLATHLEAEATEADDHKIFGTPHFISPEQARGERVDCRSDLYSLGATGYRLLCGRTPFEGSTTRDILRGHFFETPKPLAEQVADLPPELDRIVQRLLQKKPDDRYASAGELLKEIDRLRSHSVHGAAPSAASSSRRGPLVAVLVLAVAGLGLWLAFGNRGGSGEGNPAGSNLVRGDPSKGPGLPLDPNGQGLAGGPQPADGNGAAGATGNGPVAPVHPAQPGAGSQGTGDDDTVQKLFEARAELAYRDVPKELPPDVRRDQLRQVAQDFDGTSVATHAREEADALDAQILRESEALALRNQEVTGALSRLSEAAKPGAGATPAAILSGMLAVAGQDTLAAEPKSQESRRALYHEALVASLDRTRSQIDAAEQLAVQGDFAQMRTRLSELLPGLELPALPEDLKLDQYPELGELRGLATSLRSRLENLDSAREQFLTEQARKDVKLFAASAGGPDGLERELRTLDLDAAAERLSGLQSSLATELAKKHARELREGLLLGRQVLATLGAEFGRGTWRRKTITDPRGRRASNRNVAGADAQGLTLDGDGERLPWSAFGGRTRELHQLFFERLSRPYTPDELAGIETLMRVTAVVQAIGAADEMFHPKLQARFDESEVREMVEGFELARTWGGGAQAHCAREAEAATILAHALRLGSGGSWSGAVAGIERLLHEFPDTLLVRLLSNGEPPPSATRAPDAPPAPKAPGSTGGTSEDKHE
jgi:protein kinase-like protein/FHA domain-containing protein